ncbi:L,D-transpeptidase [Lichenibacterium dinghuense]|uniref:L,D-transpeptidase n=1 Tax=Lichenibacterium dinghuense TaxID=2895977 RepID=UPI003D17225B
MGMAWRAALAMAGAVALSGCEYKATPDPVLSARDRDFIAQVPKADMGRNFERYQVDDPTGQPPGTIVVDTREKLLYYVLAGGKAVRYGVATGAEAYGWHGTATVKRMAEWPRWMPPADMVKRWPHLKPVVAEGGMPGGPENPLGARALYLYDGAGHDTLYRIHGTNEPTEIGHDASSGCIRMRDIDVIDLYNRAKVGTRVVVM